jgi:peptidoglycan/LPS O-acetylase OafA/YrhL
MVSTIASTLFIPKSWLSGTNQKTGLAAFFGFSNFILVQVGGDYFSPRVDFNPFTQTWSLAVEEQFYLVFPYLFISWLRSRQRTSAALFGVLLAASLVWAFHLNATYPDRAFYMLASRFWELAAGVLLFQCVAISEGYSGGARGSGRLAAAGGMLSLLAIGLGLATASPSSTPFPGAILPVVGTLGVLGCLYGRARSGLVLTLLSHEGVRFIGRISYSLYLWHWPIFVLFRWTLGLESPACGAAALAATFGVSVASFRWVETPPRRALAASRLPRVAAVGLGVLALVLGWGISSGVWALQPVISLSTVTRHAAEWYPDSAATPASHAGCRVQSRKLPIGIGSAWSLSRVGCDWPITFPHSVFVLGDSHASAYEAMLRQVVLGTGTTIDVYTTGGCGFISLLYADTPSCAAFKRAAITAALAAIEPGDVVFLPALRLPRIVDEFAYYGESAAKAEMLTQSTAAVRQAEEAASAPLLNQFTARGAEIVLEAPLPVFKSPAFRCADWFDRRNPICAGGSTIDRSTIETLRAPVMAVFSQLQRSVAGVHVWDPLPVVCPGEVCSEYAGASPLFFDGDHLSAFGGRLLQPSFEEFVMGLAGSPGWRR